MKNTAIYYKSAEAARASGELDAYRASAAALRKARDVIDAEITAHFDGWRLAPAALENMLDACGAEALAVILAATIAARDWDGRFSRAARSWAAAVKLPAVCSGDGACWYACRAHSAILDGLVDSFRRRAK